MYVTPLVAHSRASIAIIPLCPIRFSQRASPPTSLGKAENKGHQVAIPSTSSFPHNSNLPASLSFTPSSFQCPKKTNSLFFSKFIFPSCQFYPSYLFWDIVLPIMTFCLILSILSPLQILPLSNSVSMSSFHLKKKSLPYFF